MTGNRINQLVMIQEGLEQLWPLINFYNLQTGLSDYSAPVLEASKSIERMIILLAEERGYEYQNGQIKYINSETQKSRQILTPLAFASMDYISDMPKEIRDFVKIIKMRRNIEAHAVYEEYQTKYGEAVVFAQAFDCFVSWFVLNSSTLRELDATGKEKFCIG